MAVDEATRNMINELKIASPCPMLWNNMERTPEEAIRFCGDCRKNVYDVSKMNASEVSLLLQKTSVTGRSACMQLYRRADGTVITDDCPVGLRRVRDMWLKIKSAAAGLALLLTAQAGFAQDKQTPKVTRGEPVMQNHLGGAVALPVGRIAAPKQSQTRGKVSAEIPMPGGAPAPVDWSASAMQIPSVKKLADKIADAHICEQTPPKDKLNVLRLRLKMALEAGKHNVPAFERQELQEVQASLEQLDKKPPQEWSVENKQLLRDVLTARIANSKTLGTPEQDGLRDQLSKIKAK